MDELMAVLIAGLFTPGLSIARSQASIMAFASAGLPAMRPRFSIVFMVPATVRG